MILGKIWVNTETAHNLAELSPKPIVIMKHLISKEPALLLRYSLRRKENWPEN